MKVAHFNPKFEYTDRRVYKCHVCGIYTSWNKKTSCYVKSVGKGYGGYEVSFVMCSEDCHTKAKDDGLIESFYKAKNNYDYIKDASYMVNNKNEITGS